MPDSQIDGCVELNIISKDCSGNETISELKLDSPTFEKLSIDLGELLPYVNKTEIIESVLKQIKASEDTKSAQWKISFQTNIGRWRIYISVEKKLVD